MERVIKSTICEPLNAEVLDKGRVSPDQIIPLFKNFPFKSYLTQMIGKSDLEIQYSPSIAFEDNGGVGISISSVGTPEDFSYWIYFFRPNPWKLLWLIPFNGSKVTELFEQDEDVVLKCLEAFIRRDIAFIENAKS